MEFNYQQDIQSLDKKVLQKHKVELIYLKRIVGVSHSFRDEFTKQRSQHCIELYYDNDQILYLACYDRQQIKNWQLSIMKAIKFYDWLENLKAFIKRDSKKLTEQINFKLSEIL